MKKNLFSILVFVLCAAQTEMVFAKLSPEKQALFDAEQSRKVHETKPFEIKTEVHPQGKTAQDFQQPRSAGSLSPQAIHRKGVGCDETRQFYAITQMDSRLASNPEARNLYELYQTLCVFTHSDGDTVRYANGQVATNWANEEGATWYYPNGRTATNWAGEDDATWYYSNGNTASNWAIRPGSTWYYPNRATATNWAKESGVSWYYSGNERITSSAGNVGATWYWPNGKTISTSMGTSNSWYRMDGTLWYSQGPRLTSSQLIDVPQIFLVYMNQSSTLPDIPTVPGNGNQRRVSYANFANMEGGLTYFEVWGVFEAGDIPRAECCPSREVVNGNCNWRTVDARRTFPTSSVASLQLNFSIPQTLEVQTCRFSIGSSLSSGETTALFPIRVPALQQCTTR